MTNEKLHGLLEEWVASQIQASSNIGSRSIRLEEIARKVAEVRASKVACERKHLPSIPLLTLQKNERRDQRMSRRWRQNFEFASRWFCHVVSVLITVVIAVFAADGAAAVWSTHSRIACILAILCSLAACAAHMRFGVQFGTTRPTQSRLLLGMLIAIFATVSVILGAISEYRELTGLSSLNDAAVLSFFHALLHGSAEALIPFCIGYFLELLPVAALLFWGRSKPRIQSEQTNGWRLKYSK